MNTTPETLHPKKRRMPVDVGNEEQRGNTGDNRYGNENVKTLMKMEGKEFSQEVVYQILMEKSIDIEAMLRQVLVNQAFIMEKLYEGKKAEDLHANFMLQIKDIRRKLFGSAMRKYEGMPLDHPDDIKPDDIDLSWLV